MQRFKMIIQYDGSAFCGWQKQKGNPLTVQETLEDTLSFLFKQKICLFCCGRTDAGVHASGQVTHFTILQDECHWDGVSLKEIINYYLRYTKIVVKDICKTDCFFHARFSCKERKYTYQILCQKFKSLFEEQYVWRVPYQLSIHDMQKASHFLIGTHDFSYFRHTGCYTTSAMKTISSISFRLFQSKISISFRAPSFMYKQVRAIVGSFIYVGRGKWTVSQFHENFVSGLNTKRPTIAPPSGLFFEEAIY